MKDDLLIRFIDGKTTAEETEAIIKELSQDGVAAKEWLQMVQGTRLADTDPLQEIQADSFVANVLTANSGIRQDKSKKLLRLPWIISGVSAVAATLALVLTIGLKKGNDNLHEIVADSVTDTTEVLPMTDKPTDDVGANLEGMVQERIADLGSVPEQPNEGQKQEAADIELKAKKIQRNESTYTASQVESPLFEVVRPAKTPYRVRVKNPEKEFVFEWKMSGVASVKLTLAGTNGAVLFEKEQTSAEPIGVPAYEIVDKGELEWTIEVTFNDKSVQKKTGKIELVTAK